MTGAQAEAEAAGPTGVQARTGDVDEALVEDDEAARWETGPVECEPVPGMLSMDEVVGATCLGVPQPDGTSRYVRSGRTARCGRCASAPTGPSTACATPPCRPRPGGPPSRRPRQATCG